MTADNENRYAHIDATRALAVMLVVVAHAGLGHMVPAGICSTKRRGNAVNDRQAHDSSREATR